MIILTSTVLSLDGTYSVQTVPAPDSLSGAVHYCGHPSTREILEALGASKSPENLFAGLEPGESFWVCGLAQPRSGGQSDHTVHVSVNADMLSWKKVTRLE